MGAFDEAYKANQQAYNTVAKHYSHTRCGKQQWVYELERCFLGYDRSKLRVLDIGCGTARVLQYLQQTGGVSRYMGVDSSEGMLEQAEKWCEINSGVTLMNNDMRELSGISESFDVVIFLASLHHLLSSEERISVLASVKPLLAEGGHLYLTIWNLFDNPASLPKHAHIQDNIATVPYTAHEKKEIRYYAHLSRDLFLDEVKKAGYSIKEYYYTRQGSEASLSSAFNICVQAS